jgi:hypothetical protein
VSAKCRRNESKAATCVRHKCASKQQPLGPDPCAKRACDIRGRALMNRPPEVVWNTHYCYQCGCGHTTAGLTRKSVGAKQRCSNTTQKQGNHRAITVGSYETIHESTMISGRRVSACVWCKAIADSGVGVVKHQRALEMKCWFQEPKPKPSAQNTVTRSKKSSFGDLAYVS